MITMRSTNLLNSGHLALEAPETLVDPLLQLLFDSSAAFLQLSNPCFVILLQPFDGTVLGDNLLLLLLDQLMKICM